tara:strand:- start:5245 stop:5445 length:201 start_codon:yes stop_codon:yes gene_type:complete
MIAAKGRRPTILPDLPTFRIMTLDAKLDALYHALLQYREQSHDEVKAEEQERLRLLEIVYKIQEGE